MRALIIEGQSIKSFKQNERVKKTLYKAFSENISPPFRFYDEPYYALRDGRTAWGDCSEHDIRNQLRVKNCHIKFLDAKNIHKYRKHRSFEDFFK